MRIKIKESTLNGTFPVPGSKSHTIRAVAFGALAEGTSEIRNPLVSEDSLSSLNGAEALGAQVEKLGSLWKIRGNGGIIRLSRKLLDMGNSGTSLRIFSGLAALGCEEVSFDGDSSLRTRVMAPLLSAYEQMGVSVKSTGGGFCPLSVKGPVRGGKVEIECKSSQFLTALLVSLPLAKGDTEITVTKLNEVPYVEITLDWLYRMSVRYEKSNDLKWFKIYGEQKYGAFKFSVPGDFSTATFPLVAAAVTGGEIRLENLDFNDRQGDKEVFTYLEKMGAEIIRGPQMTTVKSKGMLRGIEMDLNSTPDALPALAVAGCFAEGQTVLKNVPQARIKETDRIACMTCELRKMGADITELEDGMIIRKSSLRGAELEGHGDHRIVMSLAIAGMFAEGETTINGAEAASVTYPEFFKHFQNAGADFRKMEN